MYFANPWGLLALVAVPAILVIHLYHRRFPPLVVAGTHLWGVETEVRTAGRRRDRLPITATLLLELLAAILLGLVLAQPRFGDLGSATHLVVVLDNSASMSSRPRQGESFRDAAVKRLDERMRQLERGSVVTLILTGRRPAMLAGPAVSWEQAQESLAAWKPQGTRHEFQPAWDLAAQLADDSGELLFLTDHLPRGAAAQAQPAAGQDKAATKETPEGGNPTPAAEPEAPRATPKRMEVVAVGRPLGNVAITAARWVFDSQANAGRVFLRIENRGSRAVDVLVRGRNRGRDVFRQTIAVAGGGSAPLETEVPGGLGELAVAAETAGDPLAVDDHVTLIEPKVRMLTIAVTLAADDPARPLVDRVLAALPDWQPGEAADAHLIIGPADVLPPSRRDLWWLGIGPLDRSEEAKQKSLDLSDRNPFLIEKRNPLLEGIVLGGVYWGGVQPVAFAATPLISTGKYPLLAQLAGTQTSAYLLNIDFTRSNLADSPDWPILLSNLVEQRRENLPGLRQWNYRLNETIQFRLYEGDAPPAEASGDLVLVHGEKSRPLVRSHTVELPPLEEAGIYEIRDGDRLLDRFAVNFHDVEESTLSALGPGEREPATAATAAFEIDNPYSWLILLGIVLIAAAVLADWRVLKPR